MADMRYTDREVKKRQLRRQIIEGNSEHDQEDVMREKWIRKRNQRVIIWSILLLLSVVGGVVGYQYLINYQFTTYDISWEVSTDVGSLVGYEEFGTNVLRYTKDGASYIDKNGETVWTESYEMMTPIVAINDGYVAIAEGQGNKIRICNENGMVGNATTGLPITKIDISATGVVAVVVEDSASSYITFFWQDGTALDITIKTNMSGDGYPMDISLSEDGSQLLCSYIFIQNGMVKSRVVFYDFSEIGKNTPNRLVGGFDEPFSSTLVGDVEFLKAPYSVAFSGNGISFFSSKNLASPELMTQVMIEEQIQTVIPSEDYVGVIVKNQTGEYPNRIEIYENSGKLVWKENFDYNYTKACIDDNLVILYNEESCKVFNMTGTQIFDGTFDFTISTIRKGSGWGTLLVTGPQTIKEIQLQ